MKVLALIVVLLLTIAACRPDSDQSSPPFIVQDIKAPLGLESIPGDGEITLTWMAANSAQDSAPPSGFAVYMAAGDYSGSECSGPSNIMRLFQDHGIDDADSCPDLGPLFDADATAGQQRGGISPVAYLPADQANLPGQITITLADGDRIPEYRADIGLVAGEKSLEMINGGQYTFFVTARSELDTHESYTSNWVTETPRPEVEGLTLKAGDCYDLETLRPFPTPCSDPEHDIEIGTEYLREKEVLLIFGRNGSQIADSGAGESFDEVFIAPSDGYLPTDTGTPVLPGHFYFVLTDYDNYGKLWIENISDSAGFSLDGQSLCTACRPTADSVLSVRAAFSGGQTRLRSESEYLR